MLKGAGVLGLCLALLVAGARAEVIDRILAVVEGNIITLSDVNAAARFGLVTVPESPDPVRAVLDRLIDRALMLVEVDRYSPPEPDETAVAAAAVRVRDRVGGQAQLDSALAQVGMTAEQLHRYLRDDIRIQGYVDQRFGPAVASGETERRSKLIEGWVAGLRRRADVAVLHTPRTR